MPSASLAVVRRAHPDVVRITALSAAITFNLAALLFALRPMAPQIVQAVETARVATVRFIEPPKPIPPPPDIVLKALPKPVPVKPLVAPPVTHVQQPVIAPVITAPTTEPSQNSKPVIAPPTTTGPVTMAPGVASLAYRSSPLRFPAQAIRQHAEGTVLLLVLVDENGKPLDVKIEHSSGYPVLDKSAREQVMAGWTFQPAQMDGHAVKAWARVPVNFALQQL
ncbi:energy transducer TonB [Dyella mobilis]|uniref:Energy transducer TonB n=1 Tax=Dyella mobilis TaxID=1849582 RepID=A0ABS2KH86_9GAMM|nr:energy transducer TonB [Dyella mobilis]MBM7130122.1 energy transducer TonB [Dyella mobilis]GLQ96749.1 protein TonB [Dyella mobilis]